MELVWSGAVETGDQEFFSDLDDLLNIDTKEFEDPKCCGRYIHAGLFPKVLNINIRSINKNFNMLEVLLQSLGVNFDLIILTECRLNEASIPKALEGYVSYQTNKHHNQNDGIVMYIRSCYAVRVEEPLDVVDCNCLIATLDNKIRVIAVYRPPSYQNPFAFLNSLLPILELRLYATTIVAGDMNIDILNHDSNAAQEYLNIMSMMGFISAIDKPTRGNACLDHIMINTKQEILAAVCQSAITDHYPVMAGIVSNVPMVGEERREYTKFDNVKFTRGIDNENWRCVYEERDVNGAFDAFNLIIQKHLGECRTVRNSRGRGDKKLKEWITFGIMKSLRRRDKLHRVALKQPFNEALNTYYRKYRNQCAMMVKRAKEAFYRDKIQSCSQGSRQCWKTIKEYLNTPRATKGISNIIESDGSDTEESLQRINNYFGSLGQNLANERLKAMNTSVEEILKRVKLSSGPASSFFAAPAEPEEVERVILQLKKSTSPGSDGVTTELFQMTKKSVSLPVSHIFNLSLEQGIFPDRAKIATLMPIYKKGDSSDIVNYRPISVLTTISKILEKLMKSRLQAFLEAFNILSTNQYGFRYKRNTEDAILKLVDFVSSSLDGGRKCVGVFMDLAKAFDTVPHRVLLRKMYQ
jgi:hypothetical protein